MHTHPPHTHTQIYAHGTYLYTLLFNSLCVDGMKRCMGTYTYLHEVFGSSACGDQTQTRARQRIIYNIIKLYRYIKSARERWEVMGYGAGGCFSI